MHEMQAAQRLLLENVTYRSAACIIEGGYDCQESVNTLSIIMSVKTV
jgi:hypothetical protein